MPVVLNTLLVQLCTDFFFYYFCLVNKILFCIHWSPLEWGKWLWHKEGGADYDLNLSMAFFLWNGIVIFFCNTLCQMSNSLHVFFCFSRKSKHEIKLHTVPSAHKCLMRTVKDHFFGKSFVNYITKSLGTSFRGKSKAAFLNILNLAHNIQGKSINTK